jgi:hypothetical protein
MYGSGAHPAGECFPQPCSVEHPDCRLDFALVDVIDATERAVRSVAADALRSVLTLHPDIVAINEDRSAFQFHGSDGELVGHMTLGSALLARVME